MADYEGLESLHAGRATVIYRATRVEDGVSVIIKQLLGPHPSPDAIARLEREHQVAKRAFGPGVVEILAFEEVDGRPAIVMRDFGARSLAAQLRGPMLLKDALKVGAAVARALVDVHTANVIHKDVNPANIVWRPDTHEIQLIDFGISSHVSREAPGLESPAHLEGTLAYIAPEQTGRMNRRVDARADLYALGVTLFELLAGRRPFVARDPLEYVHAHVALAPPALGEVAPDVPPIVASIVARLLAKTAEDRYQTAAGLAADLEHCVAQLEAEGGIAPFELGAREGISGLRVPERLYGRESELAFLNEAFTAVQEGAFEVVLVSGYSGVGKTALVNEIHRPVLAARGAFVTGKFEQFNRGTPYASLLHALGGFIRRVLTEDVARVSGWRHRILAALGKDSGVLAEVLPELALIVGPQPPPPPLPAAEATNRFQIVFRRFVRALAFAGHPLVLFMDDLQWADLPTLVLLESLATDREAGHLLVLGAYRDNEVDGAHALSVTLRRIEGSGRRLRSISLRPLRLPHVRQIIADALASDVHQVTPLADLCFHKTRGNPFFLGQFLESLYRDGLIQQSAEGNNWTWSLPRIDARAATENVVDFLASRMDRLPKETQRALGAAAFLGTRFDVEAVARLTGDFASGVRLALNEAVEDDLVAVANHFAGAYRFTHDRVQQAAYSQTPAAERPRVHLAVGRLLLARHDAGDEGLLFEIVSHLNRGFEHITDPEEAARLARLDLKAGQRALGAAAYAPAHEYLVAGIRALPPDPWEADYALTLQLHLDCAEAAYLAHEHEDMETRLAAVATHGRSDLDLTRAHEVAIYARFARADYAGAIELGLQALAALGVDLPPEPTQEQVGAGLVRTQAAMAAADLDALHTVAAVTDPTRRAICQLLNTLTAPAYFSRPALVPLLTFAMIEATLADGLYPESQYAFAVIGLVLCTVGDIAGGAAAGELAMRLLKRSENPRLDNLTLHVVTTHIRPWTHPWEELADEEREVFRRGHDLGDFMFACFGANMACLVSLLSGQELGRLRAEVLDVEARIRGLEQAIPLALHNLLAQLVDGLLHGPARAGLLSGTHFDAETTVPALVDGGDASTLYVYHVLQAYQCVFLGDYPAAARTTRAIEPYLAGAASTVYTSTYVWLDALAHLLDGGEFTPERRARIAEDMAQLEAWCEHSQANQAHRLALLRAVVAQRLPGEGSIHELFPRAIELATAQARINEQALANELAGLAYRDLGNRTVARAYLAEARHLYERWGAAAKVRQMTLQHTRLLGPTRTEEATVETLTATNSEPWEIDARAVFQASRAVSEEIVLSRLVARLLEIALEISGARFGALLLVEDQTLKVRAEAHAQTEIVVSQRAIPIAQYPGCSHAVLRYVQCTGAPVVEGNAARSGLFMEDPFVREHGSRSLMCLPLQQGGRTNALLYLANDQTTDTFTQDRVEPLRLVAAQAAISLENALLYDSLEAKVQERTEQLEEARRRSDELLLNVLPAAVADELKATGRAEPVAFASATVIFTDFVGFTRIAEEMSARELVDRLDRAFSALDEVVAAYGLEKLKTIGDAYMCAGGIPQPNQTHAVDCVLAGLAFQRALPDWTLRLGIHTGPLVAGVIGRRKFAYDVWGDTVNIASRMESSGAPGRVNISASTHALVRDLFDCESRGEVAAKNKGLIPMYYVNGIRPEFSAGGKGQVPNAAFAQRRAEIEQADVLP